MKSLHITTPLVLLSVIAKSSLAWTSLPTSMIRLNKYSKETRGSRLFSSKKEISIAKYEGLGNDFILVDARDSSTPPLTPEESAKLCDRNFSVGGDGVIFALAPPKDEDGFDFRMRIYNSDGSEPEMCGNGIRCLAAFLSDLGESSKSYRIDTLAGPIVPVMNEDGSVTVDMGEPILDSAKVPTTLKPNDPDGISVVQQNIETVNSKVFQVSCVSMGNPHAVIFVDDLETSIDFDTDGPALESDPAFPARTNVEFVQVLSPTHLKMKVWERGAGPTLACGTGACALVVAAIRAGKIPRPDAEGLDGSITVSLPGGDLFIEWRKKDNRLYMTGPADLSFQGTAVLK